MREQGRNPSMSETRNSQLRQLARIPVKEITNVLHERLPWLHPDHITIFGVLGTAAGSALAAIATSGRDRIIAGGVTVITSAADAFDGALARKLEAENPGSIDLKKGGIYDAVNDRVQELFMALSRTVTADKRGNKLGKSAALLNAVTNSLPSVARAFAEKRGVAVPETGKGITGIVGTRVGRAVIGIAGMVVPEIKGIPIQAIEDLFVTQGNLRTAFDRLKRAYGEIPTLSKETRKDAEVRFKALALFAGVALAATAIAYLKLKKKPVEKTQEPLSDEDRRYLQIFFETEALFKARSLDHRFLGGTVAGLFGPTTQFAIDFENRRVKVLNPEPQSMRRKRNNTTTDIDALVFTPDLSAFLNTRQDVAERRDDANAKALRYPNISIEGARHPGWRERKKYKQFVTAFEVDKKGRLSMVFHDVKQEIPWESVEPWKYEFNGIEITGVNPIMEALCYAVRSPSGVKKKDRDVQVRFNKLVRGKRGKEFRDVGYSKMAIIGRVAHQVIEQAKERGIEYFGKDGIYQPWVDYIHRVRDDKSFDTDAYRKLMKFYWDHDILGTDISQGTGPLGGLANLSNRFSG